MQKQCLPCNAPPPSPQKHILTLPWHLHGIAWHYMAFTAACQVFTGTLQLAVGCRQMLKEKRYAFPPVKMELAGDFFTILITFAMEAAEADPYDPQGTSS